MGWQTIVKENDLDVSEINLEQVLKLNRLDGEYYKPLYLGYEQQITNKGYKEIQSFASITDGIHSSIDFDEQSTINLLSAMSPKDNYFDISRNKTISETQHKKNPRTELQEGDVIVSTVGTIGNCAVVDKTVLPANSDRHIGIIRVKSDYLPHFLSTFLLTKYGKFQTLREATGNVQLNLFIEKIRTLKIPIASDAFQKVISDVVIEALSLREQAKGEYAEVEKLLLKEIDLEGYVPSEENTSVRELTECLTDNRFDAEYWQVEFDAIQNTIRKNKDGFDTLDNLFEIDGEKIDIDPEKEYLYAELADVNGATGTIDNLTLLKGADLPSRGRMKLKRNDLIVSSVEGSLEKIALVSLDKENIVGSTGFFVLRAKEYEPEVALSLLKLKPIQKLLKRQAQGTILTAIPKSSLSRVLLPKINTSTQRKVKSMVYRSHMENREAKELLEKAKRAVEIFIEKDEQEALKYLAS